MTQVFRAPAKQWLLRVVLPLVVIGALSVLAIGFWPETIIPLALLAVLICLGVFVDALPLWRMRIYMDHQSIWGKFEKRTFKFDWTEIVAAQLVMDLDNHEYMRLATSDTHLEIPLKTLDADAVMRAASFHLRPDAFEPNAFDKVPAYRAWTEERDWLLSQAAISATVRVAGWIKAVGWLTVIMMAFFAFIAWQSGDAMITLIFVAFVGLGLVLAVWAGSTRCEISVDRIRLRTALARYEMRWDEVRWIETDRDMRIFVLNGEGKRLSIPGVGYWSRTDKSRAWTLFIAQVDARSIVMKRTFRSQFKLSKNTKVHR